MNSVTLIDSSNSKNFIRFIFEKGNTQNTCSVSVQLQNTIESFNSDKFNIHFTEIIKIANWYNNMPNYIDDFEDLKVDSLNLKFFNYFFEKGEGTYNLTYTNQIGNSFMFQFWEQIGGTNIFIYNQFMQCLEKCSYS